MSSTRIRVRLSKPVADFVERMVGLAGLYATPSEYVRELIRRDMERHDAGHGAEAILAGYRDQVAGAAFTSAGDFASDMALLDQKDADGWR